MMPVAELPLYVDSTMMSCFRSCPRKFYLEFALGLRPAGISIDLHAGGCFASALEEVYESIWVRNLDLPAAIARASAVFEIAWGDFEIPEYKKTGKTKDRVWAAIESYFEQYPPRTDHVQPYFLNDKPAFEFTFSIPLDDPSFPLHPNGGPFMYSGRFDMLGKYMGRPAIRDEKTTGTSIGQQWVNQWNLRSQFIGYKWACQQSGIDVGYVVVRGIAIQKTQIVHAEALKDYSQTLIDRWYEQLKRDLWRLRRAWDEGYFDYNLGESCSSYGGCMFMDPCSSRDPENYYSQYAIRKWNPLQKNPVVENVLASRGQT